jgi:ubiquinone biosynthesis protein UbiJ
MLKVAAAMINNALATDPEFVEALSQFAGRRIRVRVTGVERSLDVVVEGAGVQLEAVPGRGSDPLDSRVIAPAPDVELSGPPSSLLSLLTAGAGGDVAGPLPPRVEVHGDVSMLDELRRLARNLRLDWEEITSRVLGDQVARGATRATGAGTRFIQDAHSSALASTGEWLRYESGIAVGPEDVERFCVDVDDLRDDTARLEARLKRAERLEARLKRIEGLRESAPCGQGRS